MKHFNRREFLKTSVMGSLAVTYPFSRNPYMSAGMTEVTASRVAITTGDNRADIAFRSLEPFARQIKNAIGNRQVVLKPNNVLIDFPLSSTHADTIEGVLEFLKSIRKLDNVIIAESAANGPTLEGFDNYGYYRLVSKYGVKLVDLDQEKYRTVFVFDEKDFSPHPVRMSAILLDQGSYIVSLARMKTHDRVVATLSLKNIVFGAPVKDPGYTWTAKRKAGTRSDKSIPHGSGYRAINYNLSVLAAWLHPHLSVIDGFEGMEGNGPNYGTPVDHRICVTSPDWFAADRVAVELMGIDYSKIGYLNYCARTGLGNDDLNSIGIIGEKLQDHIKHYKLNSNIDKQLVWMQPAG
jgi:uncharacterized protein (DUF362 family)